MTSWCFIFLSFKKVDGPIKSGKSADFDSLFSSSLPSDRKYSKVRAEIDENRRRATSAKDAESRRKRKHDGDGGAVPRIKLKISLKSSPDKPDNTYKVCINREGVFFFILSIFKYHPYPSHIEWLGISLCH